MRWYVSRNGETVGPIEEAQVTTWFHSGMREAMVRDEAGGPWTPILQSPFALTRPPPVPAVPAAPTPRSVKLLLWLGIPLGLILLGLLGNAGKKPDPLDLSPDGAETRRMFKAMEERKAGIRSEQVASPPPAAPDKPSKSLAWVMAQQFVKDSLKAPGSAEFGGILSGDFQNSSEQVTDLGDGTFLVRGWVDAQNSFGAQVRSDFTIKLRYTGNDRWHAIEGPRLVAR